MGWWKNLLLMKTSSIVFIFLKIILFTKIKNNFMLKACSSVDRASDSDSESQGFESLHAYIINFIQKKIELGLLWFRHLKFINV